MAGVVPRSGATGCLPATLKHRAVCCSLQRFPEPSTCHAAACSAFLNRRHAMLWLATLLRLAVLAGQLAQQVRQACDSRHALRSRAFRAKLSVFPTWRA